MNKIKLSLRLDDDVVQWFKQNKKSDENYQSNINQALREYIAYYNPKDPGNLSEILLELSENIKEIKDFIRKQ